MYKIVFFVEDTGHKAFLETLVIRLSRLYKTPLEYMFECALGGHGEVILELRQFIRDIQRDKKQLPDLLVVATDGNCKGFLGRKQEIDVVVKEFNNILICAIPDPHIERWLLLDSAAFKKVFGKGCSAPSQKCERDLYKKLLAEAVKNAGVKSLFGGMDYIEDIVNAMDLERLERTGDSLSKLLKDLRQKFQEWQTVDDKGQKKLREDEAPYDVSIAVVELLPDNPPA